MTTGCALIVALCIRAAGAPLRGSEGRVDECGAHKTWPMRCRSNLFVVAGPFCKFGPARIDQGLRVRRGHLDRAIRADIVDRTRQGLHLPRYAGGRPQANHCRRCRLSKSLGLHTVVLVDALPRERALEPVEK